MQAFNETRGATTLWPYRYELLDGLRGIAALLVVIHHLDLVALGHYAVMVFFVISGYCITAAAQAGLERGQSFRTFVLRRVRRIYPPYLLALLFFALTRAAKAVAGGHNDLLRSPVEWLQNLTLTQWLTLAAHPLPAADQNPTLFITVLWSLNYEEQFYLVMAACLLAAARKVPLLLPIAVLTAVGLVWNAVLPGNWICGFFLEYWVHFALGSLLFFVLCKYPSRTARRLFGAALAAFAIGIAAHLLPWTPDLAASRRAWVELLILSVLTLGLLGLRPYSAALARSAGWKPVTLLGTISFSLYLVHQFNLTLVSSVAHRLLPAAAPGALLTMTELMLHVCLATVFWYFCERPFLTPRRPASPLGVATSRIEIAPS